MLRPGQLELPNNFLPIEYGLRKNASLSSISTVMESVPAGIHTNLISGSLNTKILTGIHHVSGAASFSYLDWVIVIVEESVRVIVNKGNPDCLVQVSIISLTDTGKSIFSSSTIC